MVKAAALCAEVRELHCHALSVVDTGVSDVACDERLCGD